MFITVEDILVVFAFCYVLAGIGVAGISYWQIEDDYGKVTRARKIVYCLIMVPIWPMFLSYVPEHWLARAMVKHILNSID